MHLAINCHTWCYTRLMAYQLSSLYMHPPSSKHSVSMTMCYTPEDEPTEKWLEFFQSLKWPDNCKLYTMPMSQPEVCNRGIGKNRFAQRVISGELPADWVHCTDVDYVFYLNYFDSVCDFLESLKSPPALVFPWGISTFDFALTDKLLEDAKGEPRLLHLPWNRCDRCPQKLRVAIGGVQFMPRSTLEMMGGYCAKSKRAQAPSPHGWRENKEDRGFRVELLAAGGKIQRVRPFRNLFRLRHRQRGAAGRVEL